jgi:hypothetical protein
MGTSPLADGGLSPYLRASQLNVSAWSVFSIATVLERRFAFWTAIVSLCCLTADSRPTAEYSS